MQRRRASFITPLFWKHLISNRGKEVFKIGWWVITIFKLQVVFLLLFVSGTIMSDLLWITNTGKQILYIFLPRESWGYYNWLFSPAINSIISSNDGQKLERSPKCQILWLLLSVGFWGGKDSLQGHKKWQPQGKGEDILNYTVYTWQFL